MTKLSEYYLSYNENGLLLHHGVKGMKWGVIKSKKKYDGDTRIRAKILEHEAVASAKAAKGYNHFSKVNRERTKYDSQNYKQFLKDHKTDGSYEHRMSVARGGGNHIRKVTSVGSILGGPVVGISAGLYATRTYRKALRDISEKPISSASNKTLTMVTKTEAKKLGLNSSTRVTGKAESDFWKSLATDIEKNPQRYGYTEEQIKKATKNL